LSDGYITELGRPNKHGPVGSTDFGLWVMGFWVMGEGNQEIEQPH